ncbi:MAG: polymer-forming cytoskeletal protein [Nitrospinota bacterium]
MWSKTSGRDKAPERSTEPVVAPGSIPSTPPPKVQRLEPQVKIGKTIVIKGEMSGEEDLTIEGRVEGRISLEGHHLTVGETGNIAAEVVARTVTIIGRMEGNLHAKERAEISESGSLIGDIRSPRVIIADGAKFKGSVDMSGGEGAQAPPQQPPKRAAVVPPERPAEEGVAARTE